MKILRITLSYILIIILLMSCAFTEEGPRDDAPPEKPVASEKTSAPEKAAEPEKTAAPEKTDAPEKAPEPEKTAAPEKTAEPEKTVEPEKTAVPESVEPEETPDLGSDENEPADDPDGSPTADDPTTSEDGEGSSEQQGVEPAPTEDSSVPEAPVEDSPAEELPDDSAEELILPDDLTAESDAFPMIVGTAGDIYHLSDHVTKVTLLPEGSSYFEGRDIKFRLEFSIPAHDLLTDADENDQLYLKNKWYLSLSDLSLVTFDPSACSEAFRSGWASVRDNDLVFECDARKIIAAIAVNTCIKGSVTIAGTCAVPEERAEDGSCRISIVGNAFTIYPDSAPVDPGTTDQPQDQTISGHISWFDDSPDRRPSSVTVYLWADDTQVASITASAADNWAYSFTVPANVAYSVSQESIDGYITTVSGSDITNTITCVRIARADADTGDDLIGAQLEILHGSNTIDTWTTNKTAHSIAGLKIGTVYTLREVRAPEGYESAADTKFEIDHHGNITVSGPSADCKGNKLTLKSAKRTPTPKPTVDPTPSPKPAAESVTIEPTATPDPVVELIAAPTVPEHIETPRAPMAPQPFDAGPSAKWNGDDTYAADDYGTAMNIN